MLSSNQPLCSDADPTAPVLSFAGGDFTPATPTRQALEKSAADWFDLAMEHQCAAAMAMSEGAIERAVFELGETEACCAKARAALAEAIAPLVGRS